MIIVTGGAGFIGSNIIKELEARGSRDIVVCDSLGDDDKWKNIAKRELANIIPPSDLFDFATYQIKSTLSFLLIMSDEFIIKLFLGYNFFFSLFIKPVEL